MKKKRSHVKTGWLVALLLACWLPAAVHAHDQLIGLLSLPAVFGNGPCDRFIPKTITLYAAANASQVVGTIRVDQYWTFHEGGGCEGLVVKVHQPGKLNARELPTKEYGYEAPAAIVLARRGPWFKVRIADGAAWLRTTTFDEYFPLENLLKEGLTYLTEAADGRLAASPGIESDNARPARVSPTAEVRILELQRVGHQLWAHIEMLSHSPCESTAMPSVTAKGWMPTHTNAGEPTIWFSSRGC